MAAGCDPTTVEGEVRGRKRFKVLGKPLLHVRLVECHKNDDDSGVNCLKHVHGIRVPQQQNA